MHEGSFVDDSILPSEFFEYYELKEIREELLELQSKAYKIKTLMLINDILSSSYADDYDVILIDYHN